MLDKIISVFILISLGFNSYGQKTRIDTLCENYDSIKHCTVETYVDSEIMKKEYYENDSLVGISFYEGTKIRHTKYDKNGTIRVLSTTDEIYS